MEYRRFSTFIKKTQYGYTAEETSISEGDAKYLRITDIVPYFVDKDRVPFCKISEQKKEQYLVRENDLLIARTGATTGYNLIVPKGFENYIFASYLVRYFYNREELYPAYLKYVLKSQQYYGFVANYIGGSAQPGMNPKAFGRFEIPYVEYDEQKRIADVLSQYDIAIENNNKRIKNLEQMAENLYKEWFVRFRFPGHEDVEFDYQKPRGWIFGDKEQTSKPKAWHFGELGELGKFIRGKNITADKMIEGDIPVISAGLSPSGMHNEANVFGESLTISASGANAGYLMYHLDSIWAADCSYYQDDKNLWFVYNSLKFLQPVISNMQAGAAQPHVYPKHVNRISIMIPDNKTITSYCDMVDPIYEQIRVLKIKNENLVKQRDLLLPRLMSGKLQVK